MTGEKFYSRLKSSSENTTPSPSPVPAECRESHPHPHTHTQCHGNPPHIIDAHNYLLEEVCVCISGTINKPPDWVAQHQETWGGRGHHVTCNGGRLLEKKVRKGSCTSGCVYLTCLQERVRHAAVPLVTQLFLAGRLPPLVSLRHGAAATTHNKTLV